MVNTPKTKKFSVTLFRELLVTDLATVVIRANSMMEAQEIAERKFAEGAFDNADWQASSESELADSGVYAVEESQ